VITLTNYSDLGISSSSKVLIIMPHPDDEAIFLAGFLHQLSMDTIAARAITMTVGEKSTLRYGLQPNDNLAEAREKELTRSFHLLGINDFHIYHYPDGKLETIEEKLKKTIQKNIAEFQPTHVLTLEPDGVYGHPDHVALSAFVTRVVKKPIQLLYVTVSPTYQLPEAVWMAKKKHIQPMHPDVALKLQSSDIIAKLKSLHAHHSQFVSPVTKLPFETLFFLKNKLLTYEFFAKGN
jgi:LmbE family N-acetylglucosaminyl deacetylase